MTNPLGNYNLIGVPIVSNEPTTPDKTICPTERFKICYVGKLPALAILLHNLYQNSQWDILAHMGWLTHLGQLALLIGWDLLHKLGVDIGFSSKTMTWDNVTIDMKPPTCTREDTFHMEEELFVSDKTDQRAKIINVKYKPANLKELTENLSQLTNNQKEQIHAVLDK